MYLQQLIGNVFSELEEALLQMDNESYRAPRQQLFNSSIGQHVRHIIELFQALLAGYENGTVSYDKRKRDIEIETDMRFALALMHGIADNIQREDKPLKIETSFEGGNLLLIDSNFVRELLYNLEHTIHHMALIRVGLNELGYIVVPDKFGVAPSTIQYRKNVYSNVSAV